MTSPRHPSAPSAPQGAGKPWEGRVTLRLYNTLTRRKEDFAPINRNAVRLYVCGPTVYDFAHIGNARPVIVFDVLFRLLRHLYGPNHVIYVRNITDVDDKIDARTERDYPNLPLNEAIAKVTAATERQFHDDVAALGALAPTEEPRATQYIGKMRAMIERLVARGVAYVAEDHVLFSPAAMERLPGAPRYGALARRSLDEMLAGARVDVAPYKRDPMDFVLWKPSKPNEPGWPSPAGIAALGRPGWHIECSAMSMATLLEPFGGGLECDDPSRNTFDIHGGGIDLVFPHHENEIAQSCCAFHSLRMANYWMHNGFLQVESEKMSKSLGNFVTIHDLLRTTKFGGRKWSGEALRLAMLRGHYRQPIDWTVKALEEAEATLDRWYDGVGDVEPSLAVSDAVLDALNDDLNTPAAISELYRLGRVEGAAIRRNRHREEAEGRRGDPGQPPQPFASGLLRSARNDGDGSTNLQPAQAALLKTSANLMGLLLPTRSERFAAATTAAHIDAARIEAIVAARVAARAARNWAESDRLRDELAGLGVAVKDNKDGTTSWEPKR
jgi:cysteinyl-tRNA synthetase